jgi:hypothetical protein
MTTPTPRTDYEFRTCQGGSYHIAPNGYVSADFARQLERELASTQKLLHDSLEREDRFYRELANARKLAPNQNNP